MNEEIDTVPPVSGGEQPVQEQLQTETSAGDEPNVGTARSSDPAEFEVPAADWVKGEPGSTEASEPQANQLAQLGEQLTELTAQAARYHDRAAQRESVIDTLHAELERLRLGERRSLLRPLLTEVCRVRDDLLRQAETLPDHFDRDRAADLLRSFAGSLEFALEDNGVSSFAPESGEPFEARLHRAAGKAPTSEESLVGTIATVVSPGYRDVQADTVIVTSRVIVRVIDPDVAREAPASAR